MVFNYFTFSPNDNYFLDVRPGSPPPFFLQSPPGSPPTSGGCISSIFGGIRIGTPEIRHTPRVTQQQSSGNQTRVGGAEESKRGQGSSSGSNHKVSSSMSEPLGNRTSVMSLTSSQAKDGVALPAQALRSSSSLLIRGGDGRKQNQPEEPLRKVMYFSCWGPN